MSKRPHMKTTHKQIIEWGMENINSKDSMFGEESGDSGTVTFEGTTISYVKDTENVALTILDANGSETIITVPIGDFTF